MIKLLIGGSPCTHWSIAQWQNRETKDEGLGWELFKNFVIAKEKFQPDYFLYENNWSASKEIKEQIQEELDCKLMRINSNLVSAQNRDRFYVFNWDVEQPQDRGISFQHIKDTDYEYCSQFKVHKTPSRDIMWGNGIKGKCKNVTFEDKTLCVSTKQDRWNNAGLVEFDGYCRYLTTNELEQLQTMPKGYLNGIPRSQQEKCIGNGWTAEVIIHILNGALKDVPKDEKILVLSMYDGIGTGRYCLNKMGFTNVEYHAYEIDKYAIQVAMHNYPDIIQHGDAFQVRNENWTIGGNKNE